jgi:hypothetical protein
MDTLSRLRLVFPGSLIPIEAVIAAVEEERALSNTEPVGIVPPVVDIEPTWRERLWLCPAETRFGIKELCEAVGKPKSWAYRHTSQKSGLALIPHRKLDGELLFLAGEVRHWLREHEEVVHAGPMESTPAERSGLRVISGKTARGAA